MSRQSAGLLMYRRRRHGLELFLVHPGGPFFRNKDLGAWTVPKGEIEPDEPPLEAARREFREETGVEPPDNEPISLGDIQQKGGKVVFAWAFEGDCDPDAIVSETFEMEWPPRSGRQQTFPEVDRAAFFPIDDARQRINAAQNAFVDRLIEALGQGRASRD